MSDGTETQRQPTYTTVGSIYNPQTTIPIQPPTRRPRARRYPQALQSPPGDSLGFPHALLSSFPVKDPVPAAPALAPALPVYSPLQQNYDRAVSPLTEQERAILTSIGATMSLPTVRSGNQPPPQPMGLGITVDDKQSSLLGENDSVTSDESALQRINVKGLTNLASYPNPMQKAAQKALAKGRTGNVASSRPGTPSSFSYASSDIHERPLGGAGANTAGAPQPLTAGPPGQRQFNQSTFRATLKALGLGPDTPVTQSANPSSQAAATMASPNPPPGFGGEDGIERAMTPREITESPPLHTAKPQTATYPVQFHDSSSYRTPIRDTLPTQAIALYYPHGYPSDYTGKFHPSELEMDKQFPASSGEKQVEDQRARIDHVFYSGARLLDKTVAEGHSAGNHSSKSTTIGIIGEGRRVVSGGFDKLPSATEQTDIDPLLAMLGTRLAQFREIAYQHYDPANPECVDDSEEGRKSFFDSSKTDIPKKRKLLRRTRRGY